MEVIEGSTSVGRSEADSGEVLLECPSTGLPRVYRGKVRELFAWGEQLLMVATDRLSAFDVVFRQGIPGKGRVLTALSVLWLRATRELVPNHLLSTDLGPLPLNEQARRLLQGRSMLVRRAQRIDVECVVRGFLAGSAWREYCRSGAVAGERLAAGLQLNAPLPEPMFTPALKHDTGHDENISYGQLTDRMGSDLAARLRDVSLKLYAFAAERCERAGLLLADTKFEFGQADGQLILIDELFTPDSSRFWPAERYRLGEPIDSLDKEPLRAYVMSSGWNLQPPAPDLPDSVVAETARRYQEALRRIEQVLA